MDGSGQRPLGRKEEEEDERGGEEDERARDVEVADQERREEIAHDAPRLDFGLPPGEAFEQEEKEGAAYQDQDQDAQGSNGQFPRSLGQDRFDADVAEGERQKERDEAHELEQGFGEIGAHAARVVVDPVSGRGDVGPGRIAGVVADQAEEAEDAEKDHEDGQDLGSQPPLAFFGLRGGPVLLFRLGHGPNYIIIGKSARTRREEVFFGRNRLNRNPKPCSTAGLRSGRFRAGRSRTGNGAIPGRSGR